MCPKNFVFSIVEVLCFKPDNDKQSEFVLPLLPIHKVVILLAVKLMWNKQDFFPQCMHLFIYIYLLFVTNKWACIASNR